ncbi:transcriptional repressor LexA [Thermoleptolyngbya sp. C42_A2020_037]|uniref:transcriptional repressor LexA n=1 Tax=Thermoleptolyngbya sp. C42_A2020_037 TaxID=2747799 RepID=UPI0019F90951|nr:transcriptional repressor LexA [Thermoleptolyngbya sp. C42_A2020_037]MBF2086105.1 repressor LexA [Thermoleptolyngbya sp. C42_A2020_037]
MPTAKPPTAKRSTVRQSTRQSIPKPLTVKQQRCLDWVTEFIQQQGISPTYEEIRVGLSYRSKDPVRSLLNALCNKGYITRKPHKARAIQVVQSSQVNRAKNGRLLQLVPTEAMGTGSTVEAMPETSATSPWAALEQASPKSRSRRKLPQGIPLLGGIAAHSPKTTFVDEPEIYLPLELFPNLARRSPYDLSQLFALRVQGDSMIESHILDGDVILLRRTPDPASLKNGAIVAARVGDAATLKHYLRSGTQVTLQPANAAYPPTVFGVEEVDVQGVYTGILVRGVV